jgi:hypothetical protein
MKGREFYISRELTVGNFISSEGYFFFEIKDSKVYGEYRMTINFTKDTFNEYDSTEGNFDSG